MAIAPIETTEDRVVLLNSGGIDSRVTAAMLVASGMEVHSLRVDWSPPVSEAAGACAQRTADLYAVSHVTFAWPLDWLTYFADLKADSIPYTVPALYLLGAMYAHHIGTPYVATGARREVERHPSLFEHFSDFLAADRFAGGKVLLRPLYLMSDAEVDAKGRELGVDMASTWSCTSRAPHCGECGSCQRRQRFGLPCL